MKRQICQISGIGSPIIDISCQVPDELLAEFAIKKSSAERCSFVEQYELRRKLLAKNLELKKFSGGSAGNAIKVLAKLIKFFGKDKLLTASFCGIAGDDEDGEFFYNVHKNSGVELKYFTNLTGAKSDCCISLVSLDGERSFRTAVDASLYMNSAWAETVGFGEFDIVLVESYLLYNQNFFPKLINQIADSGAKIALDLSSSEVVTNFKDDLLKVFDERKISIVFANEHEAEIFAGTDSAFENCRKLATFCDIACVKVGADGAFVGTSDGIFHSTSPKVEVIDTTGAGDSWAGAFLFALATGNDLKKCADFANKIAGLMVQSYGTELNLSIDSSIEI